MYCSFQAKSCENGAILVTKRAKKLRFWALSFQPGATKVAIFVPKWGDFQSLPSGHPVQLDGSR